jgi:anti-anti-sigma regulatory factor
MRRQVKDVALGDHLCLAFAHESEQRAVATGFVTGGLDRGERVLYVTDGPEHDRVQGWLKEAGADVSALTASGQLELRSAEETYLASGRFDPDEMIAMWRSEIEGSLAAGYAGLRVSGEMSWALADVAGAERLAEYERRVTALFKEGMSAAMCQYDCREFPSDLLAVIADGHPATARQNALIDSDRLRITPAFDRAGERVLGVDGFIDYHSAAAWSEGLRTAVAVEGDIQLDMTELGFIDVAGLRALTEVASGLPPGRHVRVRNLASMLGEVIRLVGWDQTSGLIIEQEAASV